MGSWKEILSKAINESTIAAQDLHFRVDSVLADIRKRAAEVDGESCTINDYESNLSKADRQVSDLFRRQTAHLSSFNVALFGRTGAGKSSLIETMTEGDGEWVSCGESDWTTDVKARNWNDLKIYDTPGINGWGRTQSRSSLEEKARQAVEIADVILVCFDSQSQQASEFSKLADWSLALGKPVIAVLNVRNPRWRSPRQVPLRTARQNLSQAVREHAGNIRDELSKLGLNKVPVIALASKRALFAKATIPFRGPDAASLDALRQRYGQDLLLAWSNYPRLEALLGKTLTSHATEMRLGMLHDQVHGVLAKLSEQLGEVEVTVEKALKPLDSFVDSVLRVVGYPAEEVINKLVRVPRRNGKAQKIFTAVERFRGASYNAPSEGEYQRYVSQRLTAEFGKLRAGSLQDAEDTLHRAFNRGESLGEDWLTQACFHGDKIRTTAKQVVEDAVDFVKARTALAMRETKLEYALETSPEAGVVDAEAGNGWLLTGRLLQVSGIVTGIATTLVTIGAVNAWNPAGWAAIAVGVIGGLLGSVLGWLGGKSRQKAEKRRAEARRDALVRARRAINDTYDSIVEKVAAQTASLGQEIALELLRKPLLELYSLFAIRENASVAVKDLNRCSDLIPRRYDAQDLIWKTKLEAEKQLFSRTSGAEPLVWLGEDWLVDTDGLVADHAEVAPNVGNKFDHGLFYRMYAEMVAVFRTMGEGLPTGAAMRWLAGAESDLAQEPEIGAYVSELKERLKSQKVRIQVVGDYNAGKSSFIKRLLLESGQPVPETLEVRADPTTASVSEYEWQGVMLIDSPGFQSSRQQDTDISLRTYPDASAIIFLFQPNLILGDSRPIDLILKGDRQLGLSPKLTRTFFIINRADELGVDPELDANQYVRLVSNKKRELVKALGTKGIEIEEHRVFAMASDPFGLVGNRTDVDGNAYLPSKNWDGFGHFRNAFLKTKREVERAGVDRAIIESGVAKFASRLRILKVELKNLDAAEEAVVGVESRLIFARQEVDRIRADAESKLRRILNDAAYQLLEEVYGAKTEDEITVAAKRLEKWTQDEFLEHELSRWEKETAKSLQDWGLRLSDEISRRAGSVAFKRAATGTGIHFNSGGGIFDARLLGRLSEAGKVLQALEKSQIKKIAAFFGHRFKPWGVGKAVKVAGKAGAVLVVVGIAFDVVSFIQDERKAKKREETRKKLRQQLNQSIEEVSLQLASRDSSFASHFESAVQPLDEAIKGVVMSRSSFEEAVAVMTVKITNIKRHIQAGQQILGVTE